MAHCGLARLRKLLQKFTLYLKQCLSQGLAYLDLLSKYLLSQISQYFPNLFSKAKLQNKDQVFKSILVNSDPMDIAFDLKHWTSQSNQ